MKSHGQNTKTRVETFSHFKISKYVTSAVQKHFNGLTYVVQDNVCSTPTKIATVRVQVLYHNGKKMPYFAFNKNTFH